MIERWQGNMKMGKCGLSGADLLLRASIGAVSLLAMANLQAAEADTAKACASLTSFKAPGFDMSITQAVEIPEGLVPTIPFGPAFSGNLPAYCRVDGVIEP